MFNHPDFANPVLSEKEARENLAPYFEKFISCINGAWAIWLSDPNRHMLNNRARASFINSVIVHLAKEAFEADRPHVDFHEKGGSFFLYVGTHSKIRFKKFKSDGTYSNLMTGQQLKLIQQMNLEGIRPGTCLTVGYQLDTLEQNIQARKVTLQSRNSIVYEIDLDEAVASSGPQPSQVPVIPAPALPPSTVGRVKAKKEAKPKEQRRKSK